MAEIVRAFAPGRTELAGNHTDHQGGRVIAAAVDCGIEVELLANSTYTVRLSSDGFAPVELDTRDLAPRDGERGTTAALVRGVIAGLGSLGVDAPGFSARATSTVPPGSGLSSSAAFELALAKAIVDASGAAPLGPVELAKVGQAAERDYFGKPCGLMDQLAVALGEIAAIDFAGEEPRVERIRFDFATYGIALCLIDTHCDHSLYTDEYAQVALDMFAVAQHLGARQLSQVPEGEFLDRLGDVRAALGDLPAMRALHYYRENRLVDERAEALRSGDVEWFLECTRRSAASSASYLQNVSTSDRRTQPAMFALALADTLLEGEGAARIHGGGFGGTIQAFVPRDRLDAFTRAIDAQLGEGSCRIYQVGQKAPCSFCPTFQEADLTPGSLEKMGQKEHGTFCPTEETA